MKRILACLLILIFIFSLAGCGSPEESQTSAPESKEPEKEETVQETGSNFKVAVLLPGPINDNGWNTTAYSGLMAAKDKYGIEVKYTENVASSDMEEFFRGYATQGYNLIIGHGAQFADPCLKVASEFPDTYFLLSSTVDYSQEPNVACANFRAGQAGFLAGAVAAAASKTNKVAFLAGEPNPSVTPSLEYFDDGAIYVKPDIEVFTGYIGDFSDVNKAKEMAIAMHKKGVDVIAASANQAGLGVIEGAQETGMLAIGFNSDQNPVAPDTVLTSIVRDGVAAFDFLIGTAIEGKFEPKMYPLGVEQGAQRLADWHGFKDKMPQEFFDTVNQVIEDFKQGKIDAGEN
jgi:basic membrane protein A